MSRTTPRDRAIDIGCWIAIVVIVGLLMFVWHGAAHAADLTVSEMQVALDNFRGVALPLARHHVSIKSFKVRSGHKKHQFEVTVIVEEQ